MKRRRTGDKAASSAPPSQAAVVGGPEVWAADRQSLCETLPTFRSYQGAAYHVDGQLKGVVFGGDGGWGQLGPTATIFRAPGKSLAGADGVKVQVTSHSWDEAAVKSIVNAWTSYHVVFLFIAAGQGGKTNSLLDAELPHPICSLGAFWITDVWPTMLDGKLSIWCKAQKVHVHRPSWWAPDAPASAFHHANTDGVALSQSATVVESICSVCGEASPRRYEQMWLCLNDKCGSFFMDEDGNSVDLRSLDHSSAFLNHCRSYPQDLSTVPPLVPPLPEINAEADPMWWMHGTATRGVVCRRCGQCLARKWFKGWMCDDCGWEFIPTMQPISIEQLLKNTLGDNHTEPKSTLPRTDRSIGGWGVVSFSLGGNETINLYRSNSTINSALGGSNDLFLQLQEDLKPDLKRFAMHNRASTEFLANHYTINFGMPYKYVVSTNSKPFSQAPNPIMAVISRLKWATQQVAGSSYDAYNELLAVGYFAGNKMGFHDDGEKELGPNVSSL